MKTNGKTLEIMPLIAAFALAALALGFGAATARAEGTRPEPACGARDAVVRTLNSKYAERPVSMGLAANGNVVEVMSSPEGTWTIVMTAPNGLTCLIAAGDYWQEMPEKVAGHTL